MDGRKGPSSDDFNLSKVLEQEFITKGGIKERMHAVRTGYRQEVDRRLREPEGENKRLRAENEELRKG